MEQFVLSEGSIEFRELAKDRIAEQQAEIVRSRRSGEEISEHKSS